MNRKTLIAAFTLWMQRYQHNPAEFASYQEAGESYGEACADYLLQLTAEIENADKC